MLPLKKILCPYDYSAASDEILKASNELALHFSAELVVLYAIESMPVNKESMRRKPFGFDVESIRQDWEKNQATRLQGVVDQKVAKELKVKSIVKYGEASNAIVEVAKEENADVIVIAIHKRKGWRQYIFGSTDTVAARVIDDSPCSVISIPTSGSK